MNGTKLVKNWKRILTRSYSSLSIISNILIALSVTGLSLLGVVSANVALSTILLFAIPLGLVGLIGRVIDQGLDDVKRDECNGK